MTRKEERIERAIQYANQAQVNSFNCGQGSLAGLLKEFKEGAVALRKKCGSLFLISKYPTTQKPDSKEPGFCCKIQLCH